MKRRNIDLGVRPAWQPYNPVILMCNQFTYKPLQLLILLCHSECTTLAAGTDVTLCEAREHSLLGTAERLISIKKEPCECQKG